MAFKAITVFCAYVLLIQGAFSQYPAGLGAPWGLPGSGLAGSILAGPGLGGLAGLGGCGCGGVASTGGGLPVTSASPCAPTGVTVLSENVYEGSLAVGGNLPLLGTVALEGVLPTAGAGAVSYGCGDGVVGIAVEEGPIITGIVPNAGPGVAGIGYGGLGGLGYGLGGIGYGPGCGCGGIY